MEETRDLGFLGNREAANQPVIMANTGMDIFVDIFLGLLRVRFYDRIRK